MNTVSAIPVRQSRTAPVGLILETLWITLLPVLAVSLLGISLLNQFAYVDPEFYTGYGLSFARMFREFGLTYYAARFPVIALNAASQALAPGIVGYALLRMAVLLASAIPLYLLARRHFGQGVAMATYAFLILNPLFPRILLWDLTTFLSIPFALAGISIWMLTAHRPVAGGILAGFFFGVSLNSHVFTGTAIGAFVLVETVFVARQTGGMSWLKSRLAGVIAGAAICQLLGLVFYFTQVGYVSPLSLAYVTFNAIVAGKQYVEANYFDFSSYYATNYEIYVPVFVAALLAAINRHRLSKDSLETRMTWFALVYVAGYIVAVFGLRMNIAQYFWYFGHLTIVVYLGVPVLLGWLADRTGRMGPVLFVAGLAAVASLVRLRFTDALRWSAGASGDGTVVALVLAAMAACLALVLIRRKSALYVASVFVALLLQLQFLSASHLGLYDSTRNIRESPLFAAIARYHQILNGFGQPGERVMSWYRNGEGGLLSLSSSNLLYTLQDPWKEGAGLPALGNEEMKRLDEEQTRYLLLMDSKRQALDAGVLALAEAGIPYSVVEDQSWGEQPWIVHARLVRLHEPSREPRPR